MAKPVDDGNVIIPILSNDNNEKDKDNNEKDKYYIKKGKYYFYFNIDVDNTGYSNYSDNSRTLFFKKRVNFDTIKHYINFKKFRSDININSGNTLYAGKYISENEKEYIFEKFPVDKTDSLLFFLEVKFNEDDKSIHLDGLYDGTIKTITGAEIPNDQIQQIIQVLTQKLNAFYKKQEEEIQKFKDQKKKEWETEVFDSNILQIGECYAYTKNNRRHVTLDYIYYAEIDDLKYIGKYVRNEYKGKNRDDSKITYIFKNGENEHSITDEDAMFAKVECNENGKIEIKGFDIEIEGLHKERKAREKKKDDFIDRYMSEVKNGYITDDDLDGNGPYKMDLKTGVKIYINKPKPSKPVIPPNNTEPTKPKPSMIARFTNFFSRKQGGKTRRIKKSKKSKKSRRNPKK